MRHAILIFALVSGPCVATGLGAQSTVYGLDPASSAYIYGCYPPCLCPIFATIDMNGDFLLTFTGFDGTFNQYQVTGVDWTAAAGSIAITGSGTYRRSIATPLLHEITLDLVIDGVPRILTSGLVDQRQAPHIEIAAAENGFFCFDYVVSFVASPTGPPPQTFRRGDCNSDTSVNIADVVFGLDVLFGAGIVPPCEDACDGNDDGAFNIADMVRILEHLFGSATLPEPLTCGVDPTPDMLLCSVPSCP